MTKHLGDINIQSLDGCCTTTELWARVLMKAWMIMNASLAISRQMLAYLAYMILEVMGDMEDSRLAGECDAFWHHAKDAPLLQTLTHWHAPCVHSKSMSFLMSHLESTRIIT